MITKEMVVLSIYLTIADVEPAKIEEMQEKILAKIKEVVCEDEVKEVSARFVWY